MALPTEWSELAPKPQPLGPGQQWHVFLSYRSVHRPWVIGLYDVLQGLGFSVFLDQYVLLPSDVLVGALDTGLSGSRAGILVWSNAASDSAWCRQEYAAMQQRAARDPGFHYVIAKLDDVDLPPLAGAHVYIDFSACREGPRGTALLRLLYGVLGRPLPPKAVELTTAIDEQTSDALVAIKAARTLGDASRLVALSDNDGVAWNHSPLLRCAVAEGLIGIGRNDEALGVLEIVTRAFPRTVRVKQLQGLAHARARRTDKAQQILAELYAAGERDPETLGIYARTWMDRFIESGDSLHLKAARDRYAEAFASSPSDFYVGINAAAKSVLLGDVATGQDYARKVTALVGAEVSPGDYWKTATAAEALLIGGDYEKACRLYDAAVAMSPGDRGSHGSTWRQAERLMRALAVPEPTRLAISKVFAHVL